MRQLRDDVDFNIKFCELVEKHPSLYDYNRSDYSNRNLQDKIWEQIGKEVNALAYDCKEKWKNIRGRYAKLHKASKFPSDSAAAKVKEYYLAPHLTFINNFLKSRSTKGKRPVDINNDNSASVDEEHSAPLPLQNATSPHTGPPSPSTSTEKTTKKHTLQEDNRSAYEYFTAQKVNSCSSFELLDSDPDFCFFKSLLPDMKAMTPAQKRQFKIGVLSLAGNLLEENERATTPASEFARTSDRSDSPLEKYNINQ